MTRTRLYIDAPLHVGARLEIDGDRARYVSRVLRLRPHDELTLFNGLGGEHRATIHSFSKNSVRVTVDSHLPRDVESGLKIHLLQGISRGDRMDLVMQKATELGVTAITPIISEYSVIKLEKNRAEKRLQHWRGICASACEQCGRNVPPVVSAPVRLRNWLGENVDSGGDRRLILKPGATTTLRSLEDCAENLTVLVGPEGGFSDDEYTLAAATDFLAISVGPRVLRTETAAIAITAGLQILFGDLATNQQAD
ncbi:MAG: 16S rRNA (uracil(1498)-N(3))-methyltransferase [Woeseiaceae bacterium]